MPLPPVWKYCYWMDDDRVAALTGMLTGQGTMITRATQNPCEALLGDVGIASPDTWAVICRYDARPWYLQSRFNDMHLVAASRPLPDEFAPLLETTLAPVEFTPPRLPDRAERQDMVRNPDFQKCKPPVWDEFPRDMGERITEGLATLTDSPPACWDDLFLQWTAVHANFISPRFRARADLLHAPYSVDTSWAISSCCVELFNLLDSPEPAFLVRPCTGAAIVKALTANQYYFVRLVKNPATGAD